MNESKLKMQLSEINSARSGSFGEHVFAYVASERLSLNVESVHNDRTDYKVNGESVDVKARRRLNSNYISPSKYHGNRIGDLIYALVDFYRDCVRVNCEDIFQYSLDWAEVIPLWEQWILGRKRMNTIRDETKKVIINQLKSEINQFFTSHEIAARTLYRTNQKDFDKESPANFLPKEILINNATIFLDFDYRVARDNFNRIIAFPSNHSANFPLIEKVRLHKQKVDLNKVPELYIFNDLDDLFKNYFERFPKEKEKGAVH